MNDIKQKLNLIKSEDVPFFNFNNIKTMAKIVDVYDGDTITIIFYHYNMFIKHKARLYGYDSPEIKPLKTIENHDLQKKCGLIVKKILCDKILNKIVDIEIMSETDKYGRLLCKIFYEGICINDFMIEKGLGKQYGGGKKSMFTLDELNKICEGVK